MGFGRGISACFHIGWKPFYSCIKPVLGGALFLIVLPPSPPIGSLQVKEPLRFARNTLEMQGNTNDGGAGNRRCTEIPIKLGINISAGILCSFTWEYSYWFVPPIAFLVSWNSFCPEPPWIKSTWVPQDFANGSPESDPSLDLFGSGSPSIWSLRLISPLIEVSVVAEHQDQSSSSKSLKQLASNRHSSHTRAHSLHSVLH